MSGARADRTGRGATSSSAANLPLTASGLSAVPKPEKVRQPGRDPLRPVLRLAVRLALVVLGVMAGLCALAASDRAWAQDAGVVLAQAQSVDQVLDNVRNWLVGILAGLATVMATVGGVRYMLADGDPGEVQRAKTAFRNAGIGYALAALAPLLVIVLQSVVGL